MLGTRRHNLAQRREEAWRPPLLAAPNGWGSLWRETLRRFFDLQAGSIWNDLTVLLAAAEGRVLDVGCGAQPYRRLLPPSVEYQGMDIATAPTEFGYQTPDTIYYSGSTWPVADSSVELVLCTETLEHVFDYGRFLSEAGRCLRPGGRLLATVPFAARWHFVPNDFWRFTPSCLQRLLVAAGFEDVAVYARGNALTVACYKVMALLLPLLLPQAPGRWQGLSRQLLGLLFSPLLLLSAVLGNLSLRGAGGDDCLGYTILARRSHPVGPVASNAAAGRSATNPGAEG
jgi:SAM-dependent methyltransferase